MVATERAEEGEGTLLTNIIAVVLTLCVLSRIIDDNPLFRGAQYLFVGVSLGYSFVVLYHEVLVPVVQQIIRSQGNPSLVWIPVTPFVLGLLFVPRIVGRQRTSWLANLPLAIIFGVGAALALVGALAGTLLPQILATIPPSQGEPVQLVGAVLLMLGVLITLSYFFFTVVRNSTTGLLVSISAEVGRWLLMVAFGFFFAGALVTYITALNERFVFLIDRVRDVISFLF